MCCCAICIWLCVCCCACCFSSLCFLSISSSPVFCYTTHDRLPSRLWEPVMCVVFLWVMLSGGFCWGLVYGLRQPLHQQQGDNCMPPSPQYWLMILFLLAFLLSLLLVGSSLPMSHAAAPRTSSAGLFAASELLMSPAVVWSIGAMKLMDFLLPHTTTSSSRYASRSMWIVSFISSGLIVSVM